MELQEVDIAGVDAPLGQEFGDGPVGQGLGVDQGPVEVEDYGADG